MYEVVVFVHVLSVFGLLLLHGMSAAAMWRLRGARDAAQVAATFDVLPDSTATQLRVMLGLVIATGLLAGAMGGFLAAAWLWASLALLVAIGLLMSRLGGGYYGLVSDAAAPLLAGNADAALLARFEAAKASWHVPVVTAVGILGLAAILWLMMAKPF